MSETLVLKFQTYEDEAAAKRLEVKAIDTKTALPIASLPPREMRQWLEDHGYRWVPGSSGLYERAA